MSGTMRHVDWKARVASPATEIANEYFLKHQKAGSNHVELEGRYLS
jgi:hypothetical protein